MDPILRAQLDYWRSNMDAPEPGLRQPELREAAPYSSVRPLSERAVRGLLDFGPIPAQMATSIATQPYTAGVALGEAAHDPSLANITNAGVQSALIPFASLRAMGTAAGVAGTGLGAAVAKDSGLFDIGANAQDALDPGARRRLQQLQDKQAKGQTLTKAEREEQNSYLQTIQAASAAAASSKAQVDAKAAEAKIAAEAAQQASEQADYNRQVTEAERARNAELGKATSFNDTATGKVYEKLGGLTPFLAGLGGGMVGRMAHGGGSFAKNYAIPAAEGTGAAFAVSNAPLFYDSFSTPALNPKREALKAYGENLPPSHPRRQEFLDRATREPELNPVRQDAREALFSPTANANRMFASALEGGLGGVTGGALPSAARRAVEGVAEIPGAAATGFYRGMNRAAEARALGRELSESASQRSLGTAEALRRSDGPTAAPASAAEAPIAPQPQLPAPAQKSVPSGGRSWDAVYSEPGTEVVKEFIKNNPGVPLSQLTAPKFMEGLKAKLPDGADLPAAQTARGYLQRLREAVPDVPKAKDIDKARKAAKDGGKVLFAAPAAGLLMSNDPDQSTMGGLLNF